VSEWELRERREREEERRAEAEELGAEGEEPLFLPHPPSWHPQKKCVSEGHSFLYLFCFFLGAIIILLGQAWAEGKGSLQRAAIARTAAGKWSKRYAAIV
jgi:hypothetical protein